MSQVNGDVKRVKKSGPEPTEEVMKENADYKRINSDLMRRCSTLETAMQVRILRALLHHFPGRRSCQGALRLQQQSTTTASQGCRQALLLKPSVCVHVVELHPINLNLHFLIFISPVPPRPPRSGSCHARVMASICGSTPVTRHDHWCGLAPGAVWQGSELMLFATCD